MSLETKEIKRALKEVREKSKKRNFKQSVELIINLKDVDVKKPEGRIQETIELPNPIGKDVNICVFATGDLALRAKRIDGVTVIDREQLEGLAEDKKRQRQIAKRTDFFIAEAPLMPLVGRVFGTILGPRGKMPTPVPPNVDIKSVVERHRRMVRVRARGQPTLQCRVGTEDMDDDALVENIQAVIRRIEGRLKRGIKNIDSIYLKLTMGPPVKLNL